MIPSHIRVTVHPSKQTGNTTSQAATKRTQAILQSASTKRTQARLQIAFHYD